jgi:hypothetical protein
MPEHPTYRPLEDDSELVNPETHHEKSDVNIKALTWFAVIFIVFAICTHFLLYLQFKAYAQLMRGATNAPLTAVARPEGSDVPAEPRLQPFPARAPNGVIAPPITSTPVRDLAEMRQREDQALNSFAWVDRQKGVARIPIDLAKQLALQHGFPVAGAGVVAGASPAEPAQPGAAASTQGSAQPQGGAQP